MKNDKKSFARQKIGLIMSVIASILILSTTTYAVLTLVFQGGTNTITVGKLVLAFADNDDNALNLSVLPISNAEGLAQNDYYDFTLQNNGDGDVEYVISIIPDQSWEDLYTGKKLSDAYVTVGLVKSNIEQGPFVLEVNDNVLDSGTISPGAANKITYRLRLWINEDMVTETNMNDISEAVWHGMISINAQQAL